MTAKPANAPLIIIVMGVSGCGKSSVASQLATDLKGHFKDGDELHPASNIDKMAAGTPLSDEDRQPWLEDVARYAASQAQTHGICVIACSALKQTYRQTLSTAGNVVFVFLEGSQEMIGSRMSRREGHFMPDSLLLSQFAALEDPRKEDNVVTVSIEDDIPTISHNAVLALRKHGFWPAPA
ncbi:gluconokinase [Granulosicoccus antarcticus]|uniref:Gluconokinase n=1 Tax=Granulosicoccus antarcticus IMCC3135 TaxID=1192854 RepID=A0A2Z2NT43_9GAMM|nr:gluconokinase [Granulosicoccus antarcticus]ASJ70284.1 Thermoresistant gluconokinase [Granulosicoccus antarcticus IMCC3135]